MQLAQSRQRAIQASPGLGVIRVESFEPDGIITGSFTDVSISLTQKALPDAVLTDGTVRVRISPAW